MSDEKGERHFDKHIWRVAIPLYEPTSDIHARLSARGAELEAAIGKLELEAGRHFAATRRDIRTEPTVQMPSPQDRRHRRTGLTRTKRADAALSRAGGRR